MFSGVLTVGLSLHFFIIIIYIILLIVPHSTSSLHLVQQEATISSHPSPGKTLGLHPVNTKIYPRPTPGGTTIHSRMQEVTTTKDRTIDTVAEGLPRDTTIRQHQRQGNTTTHLPPQGEAGGKGGLR